MDEDLFIDHEELNFARFDIPRDVLASLELLGESLTRVSDDDLWWKWAVVAAHMATNSALVGYLSHTSGVGALTDKDNERLMEWLDNRSTKSGAPPDRIAEFPVLLRRAQEGQTGSGEPIEVAELTPALEKLNHVRGRFNHFRNEGWSIHKPYLLPLLTAAVCLIERIRDHGWSLRHSSDQTRSRTNVLLRSVRDQLTNADLASGHSP